jgi:endonuclease/exonuclease/phosphatase family metal-dependent hydrolase
MKRIALLIVAVSLLQLPGCDRGADLDIHQSDSLRVMTFNIRYANPNDGDHIWENRKDWVSEIIAAEGPIVIGLQEALRHQLDSLAIRLPAYSWFGVGRADGVDGGEFSPVLYRNDLVVPIESGTFWLSETPNEIGSVGWDAALPRIASWGRFKRLDTGDSFLFVNTHFDHRGAEARLRSAELLQQWVVENANSDPVILVGDFNIQDHQPPYEALVADQYLIDSAFIGSASDSLTTFRGFEVGSTNPIRIDYIFVSRDVPIYSHRVLSEARAGRYPSDHLPVVVDVGDRLRD